MSFNIEEDRPEAVGQASVEKLESAGKETGVVLVLPRLSFCVGESPLMRP
jgi:hypothetical protein